MNLRLTICNSRRGAARREPRPPGEIPNRTAFTLVEAVFAMLLVGMLLVAALSAAGASGRLQSHESDHATGSLLAQGLMSEILTQSYQDPGPSRTFGPEPGETTTPPSRARFNDVDDYNGWHESPPQNKDGSAITMISPQGTTTVAFPGWSRSVSVVWVSSNDFTKPSPMETGIKRITVTVTHNNAVAATCVTIKANNP